MGMPEPNASIVLHHPAAAPGTVTALMLSTGSCDSAFASPALDMSYVYTLETW